MEHELTPEQISQIVRAARVIDPGFTEERLNWLIDGQKRLSDSRFCEASRAVARFEQERGINCVDALDACEELLQEMSELEGEVASLKKVRQTQQHAIREAEQRYRQLEQAIERGRKELAETTAEQERREHKLVASQKKAEKEKRRIDRKVEDYRQRANVTKPEIDAASELKSQIGEYGFSLEEMLELSKEFAGHQEARGKLVAALKEHQSLTEYVTALKEWAQNTRKTLEGEISGLKSQRAQEEAQVAGLEEIRRNLENVVAQFQADAAAEEELRQFYRRYRPFSGLLDCLASWDQVIFYRCNNPLSALGAVVDRSALAHFWADKPAVNCPHCGLTTLLFDEKPYQALDWPVGVPLKLQLGE